MLHTDIFYLKYLSCYTRHDLKPGLSTFMLICGSLNHVEETFRTGAGPLETPPHS